MAVIQISKIRVRRGKANSGSGIPQLSGGEFGWAVDTQQLFIGNGTVAEGAPAIGNTKVLTEHDNILEYVNAYQYQPNQTITGTVQRSLQNRLENDVYSSDFGMFGDWTHDDTVAIQTAINQLFNNPGFSKKVTLVLEPGRYKISNTIKLPPYTSLVGAGIDKTTIEATGNFPLFETVNSNGDNTGTTESTQCKNVLVASMTLKNAGGHNLKLHSCRDSLFLQLRLTGGWLPGNSLGSDAAIYMDAVNSLVTCSNIGFSDSVVDGVSYFVDANFDINNISFNHFNVNHIGYGFRGGYSLPAGSVDGQTYGPRNCKIYNSYFYNVAKYGIYIKSGTGNVSSDNSFIGVGNNGLAESTAQCNVIFYGQPGNKTDDIFSRTTLATSSGSYIPEVGGHGTAYINNTPEITISLVNTPTTAIRLPLIGWQDISLSNTTNGFIKLHYTYISSSLTRSGTMSIAVHGTALKMVEEFDMVGNMGVSDQLIFSTSINSAINIQYLSNELGTLRYWFEYSI